ncbi:hypothetical protein M422DRAFT_175494 [Sphaerobolus stellatus SS14]|uniref:Methanethiol oxidase n=1 Tax=Sphaerobolus stellatus (strain SS14) TaxID=990650 RepID=A0A0C9VMH7_SPHS4|nr:hypothetical protein M422DRAFT_175494 [Sphaerobolus stellatus SS14]
MPESAKGLLTRPEKWNASTHIPNKLSTPCSRFRVGDGSPTFIPTDSNTLATNIFQARCEITADHILNPINLLVSPGSEFMVVLAAGGCKEREPHMYYYSLKSLRDGSGEFPPDRTMDIPLADIAYGAGIDQERKLVFIGSPNRLKSYYWGMVDNSGNGRKPPELLPTHTFCTTRFAGPITILPAGRLIRAGRGFAGVWNLDSQPTHGPEGTDIIGEQMDPEYLDTWRDEDADIELSEGSNPDTIIAFEDSKFKPSLWHTHPDPSKSAVMLAATDAGGMGEATYYCRTLDLENGGWVITRYLGNGGIVQAFSNHCQ